MLTDSGLVFFVFLPKKEAFLMLNWLLDGAEVLKNAIDALPIPKKSITLRRIIIMCI